MDVDLSQYCDVILLWNAAAMFLISFSTDYWEYRDYNYGQLIKELTTLQNNRQQHRHNGTLLSTDGWEKFGWRNIIVVQLTFLNDNDNNYDNCSINYNYEWTINQRFTDVTTNVHEPTIQHNRHESRSKRLGDINGNSNNNNKKNNSSCFSSVKIYLFSEYANLFRVCNDLQDASRLELFHKHLLYDTPCHNFMMSSEQWHFYQHDGPFKTAENLAFSFGCLSAIVSCLSLIFGTSGSIKRNQNCVYLSGLCLGLFALFYFATIVLFLVKTQLLQNLFKTEQGDNSRQLLNDDDDDDDDDDKRLLLVAVLKIVNVNRTITLGWSFVAAVLSLIMSTFAAQVYVSKGRRITKRRRSEIRRQRLEAALMSPCQQEVALALRAKMIVVHS